MVRHGQSEANANDIWAGNLDSPLTEQGKQEAYALQETVQLLDPKPTKIIYSTLSRARDTALILNKTLDLKAEEYPDIHERNLGEWQGKPRSQTGRSLWNTIIKGAETPKEFQDRAKWLE